MVVEEERPPPRDEGLFLVAVNGLGNVRTKQQDYRGAEELLRRAIAGRERLLVRRNHPDLLKAWNDLGNLRLKQGDLPEAEARRQLTSDLRLRWSELLTMYFDRSARCCRRFTEH